jgi:phage shock protein C
MTTDPTDRPGDPPVDPPVDQPTSEPTSQRADQPPSQPTAQPTPPPASPYADQQYASFVNGPASVRRRLVRRTDDKFLGGVCAGVADHLGLDPTLVRVLTVLATVLGAGSVVIAYLVAWVIVPKDVDVYGFSPVPMPQPQPQPRQG